MTGVVVLQDHVGLANCELGSCNKTRVTSTLDGNEVIGIEAERASIVSEIPYQEATTIPATKTEPSVSCVSVVSVAHITYRLHPDLPAPVSMCPCETKI